LKKPGSRLNDNDRNAACDVAASFVSGSVSQTLTLV